MRKQNAIVKQSSQSSRWLTKLIIRCADEFRDAAVILYLITYASDEVWFVLWYFSFFNS